MGQHSSVLPQYLSNNFSALLFVSFSFFFLLLRFSSGLMLHFTVFPIILDNVGRIFPSLSTLSVNTKRGSFKLKTATL